MHRLNLHNGSYNFKELSENHNDLNAYTFVNTYGKTTIDYSDQDAVIALNTALLNHHYGVQWKIPRGYLCPPIPGRVDYLHYIADLFPKKDLLKGLDIGTGANFIYPLLGAAHFNWDMTGIDIKPESIEYATANKNANPHIASKLHLILQENPSFIFTNGILDGEHYDFTMCNPPFYDSKKEAERATLSKSKNLKLATTARNFGGMSNELWCNGGEALFLKRMIKESVKFKSQVGWFTSLLSRKQNLLKIYKQLDTLKATYQTIEMDQGNKQSRFVAWSFTL